MTETVKLAVVGAGLVGQRHMDAIARQSNIDLVAIVDPLIQSHDAVPCFATLDQMLDSVRPDGAILSTPTTLHLSGGLTCLEAGIPVLIEKPLATSVVEAQSLVDAAARTGVALLVGHHRRHNPLIQKAAELISGGAIGDVRAIQATCWFYKPDDYFQIAPWRTQKGAGPISVNLVHDVDLMRHFCGEVVSVQAQMAPSLRGFENEDVAAAVLRFASGAVGTVSVSDSIVAPWSWELTSREYPIYPPTNQTCYQIGGTDGSLSVPDMTLWSHAGKKSWWEPITGTIAARPASDPLLNQVAHFADVIRGICAPKVSGFEGLRTMMVIEAIQKAAETQRLIQIPVP